jgi:hypothetical protein
MSANKTTNCGVTQLSTHYQHEQRKEKTLAKRNNKKKKSKNSGNIYIMLSHL